MSNYVTNKIFDQIEAALHAGQLTINPQLFTEATEQMTL